MDNVQLFLFVIPDQRDAVGHQANGHQEKNIQPAADPVCPVYGMMMIMRSDPKSAQRDKAGHVNENIQGKLM
jgi:hypothetical protein